MIKNLGSKPYIFPQPVLIIATYDENGNANAMNAAWGGISGPAELMLDLGAHKTTENIKLNKEFTVAIGDVENLAACDYVGIVSGDNVADKMEKSGWTTRKSENVNAPIINELPLTMECKLSNVVGNKYFGEIVNVVVDDRILDDNDEVTLEKFRPLIFDIAGHGYYAFGEKVGSAFNDGMALK